MWEQFDLTKFTKEVKTTFKIKNPNIPEEEKGIVANGRNSYRNQMSAEKDALVEESKYKYICYNRPCRACWKAIYWVVPCTARCRNCVFCFVECYVDSYVPMFSSLVRSIDYLVWMLLLPRKEILLETTFVAFFHHLKAKPTLRPQVTFTQLLMKVILLRVKLVLFWDSQHPGAMYVSRRCSQFAVNLIGIFDHRRQNIADVLIFPIFL